MAYVEKEVWRLHSFNVPMLDSKTQVAFVYFYHHYSVLSLSIRSGLHDIVMLLRSAVIDFYGRQKMGFRNLY